MNLALNASENFANTAIGYVVLSFGQPAVRLESGHTASLQPDDAIHLGDVLETGETGVLSVRLHDGSQLDFGPRTVARMDPEVFDLDFINNMDDADARTTVGEIESAVASINDLKQFEPTAAGEPVQDGARSAPVFLERSAQSTEPEAGLETAAIDILLSELPQQEEPVGTTPVANFAPPTKPELTAENPLPLIEIETVTPADALL